MLKVNWKGLFNAGKKVLFDISITFSCITKFAYGESYLKLKNL